MEVITMDAMVINKIMARFDKIEQIIAEKKKMQPLSEPWLNIDETCRLLKVSKRTLQTYRDIGKISFSQIGGKIYFKASDLEDHLKKHYFKAFSK